MLPVCVNGYKIRGIGVSNAGFYGSTIAAIHFMMKYLHVWMLIQSIQQFTGSILRAIVYENHPPVFRQAKFNDLPRCRGENLFLVIDGHND